MIESNVLYTSELNLMNQDCFGINQEDQCGEERKRKEEP